MKKPKEGQLVVTIKEGDDCGCSTVKTGTIAKVVTPIDEEGETEICFCQSSCPVWVNPKKDIRALTEEEEKTASDKFEEATERNYATV